MMSNQDTKKPEEKKIICPLLSASVDFWVYCERERCAWWDFRSECCAIRTIAAGTYKK